MPLLTAHLTTYSRVLFADTGPITSLFYMVSSTANVARAFFCLLCTDNVLRLHASVRLPLVIRNRHLCDCVNRSHRFRLQLIHSQITSWGYCTAPGCHLCCITRLGIATITACVPNSGALHCFLDVFRSTRLYKETQLCRQPANEFRH